MVTLAKQYDNLQKIELLPFRKLCITKYEQLGIPFRCADIPECAEATITRLSKLCEL
jgi:pyruvate formate lyase activating enzyme